MLFAWALFGIVIFSPVLGIVGLLALAISLVAVRLFQFSGNYDNLYQILRVKTYIRFCMLLIVSVFMLILLLLVESNKLASLKLSMIEGDAVNRGIHSLFLYAVTLVIPLIIFLLSFPIHEETLIAAREAISELISCIYFRMTLFPLLTGVANSSCFMIQYSIPQWIEGGLMILVVNDCITLSTVLVMWWIRRVYYSKTCNLIDTLDIQYKKHGLYCARKLKGRFDFILSSAVLLLLWVLYSGKHLEENWEKHMNSCQPHKGNSKHVSRMGVGTCIALLIFSLLWFIKTSLLLAWEVKYMFNHKLESRILKERKQLYFLGILGCQNYDIFHLLSHDHPSLLRNLFPFLTNPRIRHRCQSNSGDWWCLNEPQPDQTIIGMFSIKKKNAVKNDMLMHKGKKGCTPTLEYLHRITQHFISSRDYLSKNMYVSDIIQNLKTKNPSGITYPRLKVEHLKQILNGVSPCSNNVWENLVNVVSEENEEDDFECFIQMLKRVNPEEEIDPTGDISFEILQTWMEEAQKICTSIADTLSSNKKIANRLDIFMSSFITFVTFISWLLFTGLLDKTHLSLILAPWFALSLLVPIVQNFFQGFAFVYLLHPFDVGDTCKIGEDTQLMQVKAIRIWKTTFIKDGTTEEVLYPNSELSKQKLTRDIYPPTSTITDDKWKHLDRAG